MVRKLPRDVVLLQLALVLLRGGELSHEKLRVELGLERRTAERYLRHLKDAGLPIVAQRRGRQASYALDKLRAKLDLEAIDVAPAAARSLSLLLVAAQLLPAHLGIKEAVDRTVRAALRLRGMKAAAELRRMEDAVLVLENDAKDYRGKEDVFKKLVDAVLEGRRVKLRYRSPKKSEADNEDVFAASIGLYKGGLYLLAVPLDDDGRQPSWKALERIEDLVVSARGPALPLAVRPRAIEEARRRWGPARPRSAILKSGEARAQVITLHFSEAAAPYVLARPWHTAVDVEPWPKSRGGGLRMSLRLTGQTDMFESWVKSWGTQVQVLRPSDMAERIAADLRAAADAHRQAAREFARSLDNDSEA